MAALGELCTFLAKQGTLKYKTVAVACGKFINQLLIWKAFLNAAVWYHKLVVGKHIAIYVFYFS